jgi:hypothetical protein
MLLLRVGMKRLRASLRRLSQSIVPDQASQHRRGAAGYAQIIVLRRTVTRLQALRGDAPPPFMRVLVGVCDAGDKRRQVVAQASSIRLRPWSSSH